LSGSLSATGTLTVQQWGWIKTGQAYSNVHDSVFPGGEIRGQLAPSFPLTLWPTDIQELSIDRGDQSVNLLVPSAGGLDYTNDPSNGLTFVSSPLNAGLFTDYPTSYTRFWLYIDSFAVPGSNVQARISYDWTGDGTWDRTEWFSQIPLDDVDGQFDVYHYPGTGRHVVGSNYQPFVNGYVRLDVWATVGTSPLRFRVNQPISKWASRLSLPHKF